MAKSNPRHSFLSRTRRFMITGVLTLIPLWITWIIFELVFDQLSAFGKPMTQLLYEAVGAEATWVTSPLFQTVFSVFLTLLTLYLIGWATSQFFGRRLIGLMDRVIHRIPVVEKVYGSIQKLMGVLQQKPDGVQRVVLIEFPSAHMKTVGFVTRTLTDEDTGEIIAAVYVPTTPNPTSGYLELVPIDQVTSTDWTMDEAMSFIISGGAISRETINYRKSHGSPMALDEGSTAGALSKASPTDTE